MSDTSETNSVDTEPEFETKETGDPIPPRPLPDVVEVFNQSARLLDGLPYGDQDRVLRALCILFEVQP
jgi:hypothetical protein